MREQTMTRKELLARKHETALIKRIVIISLFSLGLMALVFYYAIPAMVKIADIWETTRTSDQAVVTDPNAGVPLIRPRFEDDQNRATNSAELDLKGTATAGMNVHLVMNGQEKPSVVADNSAVFTFSGIRLADGVNTFVVYAQDDRGRKSDNSVELKITYDSRAPKLEVSEPGDGAVIGGARASVITLKGKTDEATQMYVNGGWIILKADGSFEHQYQLTPGENVLTLYAMDEAGNKSPDVVRRVTYNP